jgi:diadenylate cyclase
MFWDSILPYFSVFSFQRYPLALVDIVIVALLFYGVYSLIKDTKAIRMVIGIVIIGAVFVIGQMLNLIALAWLLKYFAAFIVVAIPIIFQPELRRALERLGRPRVVGRFRQLSRREAIRVWTIVVAAVEMLVKNKIGGLIVFRRATGLADHVERGTVLNAALSKELLLNLLFPNSPLHDGAVLIGGNQILAAGVILPLTERETAYQLGTRHKAALGITEETDAIAVVVSEERGEISVAVGGKMFPQASLAELEAILRQYLT